MIVMHIEWTPKRGIPLWPLVYQPFLVPMEYGHGDTQTNKSLNRDGLGFSNCFVGGSARQTVT